MSKWEKLLEKLNQPDRDATWNFDELTVLLDRLGWEMRICGSHHFFRKSGVAEVINLQPAGSKAKPYQVRQARNVLKGAGQL